MKLTAYMVYLLALKAGFHPAAANIAVCVAQHESSLRPSIVNVRNKNGTRDLGLMQINSRWWVDLCSDLHYNWSDPLLNMRCAYRVYEHVGYKFNQWVAYKKYCGKEISK